MLMRVNSIGHILHHTGTFIAVSESFHTLVVCINHLAHTPLCLIALVEYIQQLCHPCSCGPG